MAGLTDSQAWGWRALPCEVCSHAVLVEGPARAARCHVCAEEDPELLRAARDGHVGGLGPLRAGMWVRMKPDWPNPTDEKHAFSSPDDVGEIVRTEYGGRSLTVKWNNGPTTSHLGEDTVERVVFVANSTAASWARVVAVDVSLAHCEARAEQRTQSFIITAWPLRG